MTPEKEPSTNKTYESPYAAARAAGSRSGVIVAIVTESRFADVRFDWFPRGHPLPSGAIRIGRVTGGHFWRTHPDP